MKWNRRSIRRPRYVALDDKRSPMLRLLQDCTHTDGSVQVEWERQFQTLFKAIRLGLVDKDWNITDAGRVFAKDEK